MNISFDITKEIDNGDIAEQLVSNMLENFEFDISEFINANTDADIPYVNVKMVHKNLTEKDRQDIIYRISRILYTKSGHTI